MFFVLEAADLSDRRDLEDDFERHPELARARLLLELVDEARRQVDALCIAIEQAEHPAQSIIAACAGDPDAVQAEAKFHAAEAEQFAALMRRLNACIKAMVRA